MLARAVFYPSLLYNVVMEKVSSRQWYNRIDETVLLGALPFRSMTSELVKNENVKGVVTLNEEYETKYLVNTQQEWLDAGVVQLRLDTMDLLEAPSEDKLVKGVNFIIEHKDRGDCVYVHCKAGRTRSATLVACYLMQMNRWDPEIAVTHIQSVRPHISIRTVQWQALRNFHKRYIHRDS